MEDSQERLNTLFEENPDLVKMDDVQNIQIDLGKTNKYNSKTILHLLIEDQEEEQLIAMLQQYIEQLRFDGTEEAATNENKHRIKFANLDVNAQDINGWTPLVTTIVNRLPNTDKVCNLLLEIGADPFIESKDGKNAFHWAARIGSTQVLKKLCQGLNQEQIDKMLNTETRDINKLKPIHFAVRFDHIEVFKFLISQSNCDINFNTSKPPETSPDLSTCYQILESKLSHYYSILSPTTTKTDQTDPNSPTEPDPEIVSEISPIFNYLKLLKILLTSISQNDDTILHTMVRYKSVHVFRYLIGSMVRFKRKCDQIQGIDIPDDTSVEAESEERDQPESSQIDPYWNDVDGDVATTDSDHEEGDGKEEQKLAQKESDDAHDPNNITPEEAEKINMLITTLCSYQNDEGNTILHEAIIEDRTNFVETIKMIKLVNQDLKNHKGLTFSELKEYLVVNAFIRRYKDAENEVRNRKQKYRRCGFWSTKNDSDQYEEEEEKGIINLQKVMSPEERRKKENRALMSFLYFFLCVLILFAVYYVSTVMSSKKKVFDFPPNKRR